MVINESSISKDTRAAADMATAAGELLLQLRDSGGSGDELKNAGDAASNEYLLAELARRFPDDAVLTEESADVGDRQSNRRVWIIDPLDGTREYSEPPRTDWAVHVALVVDGRLETGAVALPARGMTLCEGALPPLDAPIAAARPRLVVSRTRPAEHALQIAEAIGAELVPMGSAGAKAMAIVLGEADVYAHSGGQYEWDSAAPVAVARAAGLHVSRLDGSALVYNQPNPWLPDLLVCRPEFADAVIAAHRHGVRAQPK